MIQPFFLNQMGNNLDVYGAAIGLFHACKMSLNIGYDSRSDTFHDILITNLRCSFLFASLCSEHYQIPLISLWKNHTTCK